MRLYKPENITSMLVYGAPGSGKTHFASEIAREYKTLLFDIDHGASTTQNISAEAQGNLVIIQYTKFTDLNTIYRMLLENNTTEKWNTFFKQNEMDLEIDSPFEAVIIDSLSELQRQMESELSQTKIEDNMKSIGNIKPLRIQDWGALSTLTETVIADAYGKLPLMFIVTAHEQLVENEHSGEVFGIPKLRGKLAFDVAKHFDVMGRLTFARSGQRVLMTKTQNAWQAKSRGKHDDIIVNPDIIKIIKEEQ